MGDGDWIEVTKKKHGSVFNRLKFPQAKEYMMVDLARISLSVYVSNFPSHLTMRELWNICGKKGTLADVFIAKHKNKLGQMFGVLRPQVVDSNRTASLSSKVNSYVNVTKNSPYVAKNSLNGSGNASNYDHKDRGISSPTITLSQYTSNDFPLALLGCYKDLCSIANLVPCVGMKDLWRLSKRLCVKSSHALLVFESTLVTLNNVTYAILVRELCSWTPSFISNDSDSDDDANSVGFYEQHEDKIYENNEVESVADIKDIGIRSDPFGLATLINKTPKKATSLSHSNTPKHPPGFSPFKNVQYASESIHNFSGDEPSKKLVDGFWKPDDNNIRWINFYAPQSVSSKVVLWSSLSNLVSSWDGALIMMGDFNEVREAGERHGGFKYTWTDKWGSKMSKLDRFWASKSFYEFLPHNTGVVLEKGIPDHRPILIKEFNVEYGPTLFRFFNSWMEMEGFQKLVVETWNNDGIVNDNARSYALKKNHQTILSSIDAKIDQGCASEDDFKARRDSLNIMGNQDRMQLLGAPPSLGFDLLHQISPDQSDHLERPITRKEIKRSVWDCGGDRAPGPNGFTFKFFTTFWNLIEEDVYRFVYELFHTNRFPKGCNSSFIALIPKIPCAKFVSDFRPISLIRCQYKIIGKIIVNRLSILIESCVSPAQSAFIKGRNILDGPLILSEVLAWYQKRKKGIIVFKVDFEKAFDSLRWDFLDLILEKFDFGLKWRSWIKGCLQNGRSSILVNGSPTDEFELFRGLRQGDPMSPFLFILAMEGLHSLMCKAETIGLFKGVSIGNNNLCISHLMYADDVIIFGDWSLVNANNLISILRCFYLILGLKINVQKSNVFGVGVTDAEVSHMAHIIGCEAAKFLFKYLGIPVGCNMTRVIQCIYGLDGGIHTALSNSKKRTTWGSIVHSITSLKQKGIDLTSLCFRKIGNGADTRDSWHWALGSLIGFSVASVRLLIDSRTLDTDNVATRWNRKDIETVNHSFFNCGLAKDLWALLAKWWDLDIPICGCIAEWYDWLNVLRVSSKVRLLLEGGGGGGNSYVDNMVLSESTDFL
ncbi:putative RNA-directed DNA polymerase, eukaryota, reverse transcriptase zinc-binding domain protein [Tanacetum coccineum]